jgi:hypothetical protein
MTNNTQISATTNNQLIRKKNSGASTQSIGAINYSQAGLDANRVENNTISSQEYKQFHKDKTYSFRRGFKKILLIYITIFLGILLVTYFARSFVDSILLRIDFFKAVHNDTSTIDSGVIQQVKPKIALIYRQHNGQLMRVLADGEAVSEFVRSSIKTLETSRVQLRGTAKKQINVAVTPTFLKMRSQINAYADWNFAWLTTYKILMQAIASATNNALAPSAISLNDAIAADVEKYFEKHFEDIVLRPEISNTELKLGFESALQKTQREFLLTMSHLDQEFQKFATTQSNLLSPVDINKVEINLDWNSQFKKVTVTRDKKSVGDGLIGVGRALAGGIMGKVVVGKVASGMAIKTLAAKLATPFATKAAAVAAGTAAGAMAGPVGGLIGLVGGLGVDYLVNEGFEQMGRDDFVTDTNAVVSAIQQEWENNMTQSLEKAVDTWFDDAINLLADYDKN